jgi:hypothetical protein
MKSPSYVLAASVYLNCVFRPRKICHFGHPEPLSAIDTCGSTKTLKHFLLRNHLADAESDRHGVGVVLEAVRDDRRRTKIGPRFAERRLSLFVIMSSSSQILP